MISKDLNGVKSCTMILIRLCCYKFLENVPKVIKKQFWEINFREELSYLFIGFNVKDRRDKVLFKLRIYLNVISINLPFELQSDQKIKTLNRIQNI